MIERFQLADCAALRPRETGPAQRLRCAVARALIAAPKLLLLDERAFDAALVEQVRAAFAGPILLVAADLDLCCATADEAIVWTPAASCNGAPRAPFSTGPHRLKSRACWESPTFSRPPSSRSIPRATAAAWISLSSPWPAPTFPATSAATASGWPSIPKTCACIPETWNRSPISSPPNWPVFPTARDSFAWSFPAGFGRRLPRRFRPPER